MINSSNNIEYIADIVSDHGAHFMGMSLISNLFFSKRMISKYVNQFGTPFIFIVADTLEVVNYRYLQGLTESKAKTKARRVGKNYLRGYCRITKEFPDFFPIMSSRFDTSSAFQKISAAVYHAFVSDPAFATDVREEVQRNLGHALTEKHPLALGQDTPRLEQYVLGEVALSLCVYSWQTHKKVIQVSSNPNGILSRLEFYPRLLKSAGLLANECRYIHWNPGEENDVSSSEPCHRTRRRHVDIVPHYRGEKDEQRRVG